jgi:hypothetical protein
MDQHHRVHAMSLGSDRCRVASKMLLQVAAQDIGQLTDKERITTLGRT